MRSFLLIRIKCFRHRERGQGPRPFNPCCCFCSFRRIRILCLCTATYPLKSWDQTVARCRAWVAALHPASARNPRRSRWRARTRRLPANRNERRGWWLNSSHCWCYESENFHKINVWVEKCSRIFRVSGWKMGRKMSPIELMPMSLEALPSKHREEEEEEVEDEK